MYAVPNEPTTEQLEASNLERLAALNAQGQVVGGIDEQYIILLLETLLGPERAATVKHAHHLKLAAELDRVDSIIRRGALTAPLQQGAR